MMSSPNRRVLFIGNLAFFLTIEAGTGYDLAGQDHPRSGSSYHEKPDCLNAYCDSRAARCVRTGAAVRWELSPAIFIKDILPECPRQDAGSRLFACHSTARKWPM